MSDPWVDLGLELDFNVKQSTAGFDHAFEALRRSVYWDKENNCRRGSQDYPGGPVPIPVALTDSLFKVRYRHFSILANIAQAKLFRSEAQAGDMRVKIGRQVFAAGIGGNDPEHHHAIKAMRRCEAMAQSGIAEKIQRRKNMVDSVADLRFEWLRLGGGLGPLEDRVSSPAYLLHEKNNKTNYMNIDVFKGVSCPISPWGRTIT